jgi:hypothetical protein
MKNTRLGNIKYFTYPLKDKRILLKAKASGGGWGDWT